MKVTPTASIVMPISGTRKKIAATKKAVERKTGQYASANQRVSGGCDCRGGGGRGDAAICKDRHDVGNGAVDRRGGEQHRSSRKPEAIAAQRLTER